MSREDAINGGFVDEDKIPEGFNDIEIKLDKNGKVLNWDSNKIVENCAYLQIKKELYVLFKFLNFVDRTGLKVTNDFEVRKNIHNYIEYNPEWWPEEKFIDLMSLAQHYGIPTRLLDWSYDYKSALYFALKDILEKPCDADGVLWALNYKLFTNVNNYGPVYNKLQFYRPEYSNNPNLKGQKGLFTYIVEDTNDLPNKSLDEILIEEQKGNFEENYWHTGQFARITNISVPENDFLFYRIKIPKDKKHSFLKALYRDGYSEEYLFPGYSGGVSAIKNRVKLDNYIKNLNKNPKINMIMLFNESEINYIFEDEKRIMFKKSLAYEEIENIYIYSKQTKEILGFFKGNEIYRFPLKDLWFNFNDKSTFSKKEFSEYFKNVKIGYAIKINNLIKFKYPFNIPNFELNSEFYFIHPNDNKISLLLNFNK